MWQQYFHWISGILLHGDFGRSLWQNTPVSELLGARLPITFQLGLHGADRGADHRAADRDLFGDPAGHRRRITSPARSRS